MSRRVQLLTVLLILVALVLSGCNAAQQALEKAVEDAVEGAAGQIAESVTGSESSEEGSESTATTGGKGGATTASATATPQEEPAEEETIDANRATDLERLDSYRMAQVIDWKAETDEGSEEGRMRWEIAYVREPRAMHWRMMGQEGPDADEESWMEMIWIDGVTYMNYGDEWMAFSSDDEDMAEAWGYAPEDVVTDDSQRIGTETVNGYRSVHYRATGMGLALAGELRQADYWVSTEYDVVVRGIVQWISTVGDDSGEWNMQWDVTDINEPIVITAPEGVDKPGLPDDVPLMPGASNVSSMMGFTNFETDATAAEVTEFYMQALEDNGWTFESSMIETMHSFNKEGRSLTLMIDDESTPTTVTIMIGEG